MRASKKPLTLDLSASGQTYGMEIQWLNGYSIVVSWSGSSPVGTLKLQGSNDAWDEDSVIPSDATQNASATWVDIANSTATVNGSGTFSWNAADQNYQAVRIVYTKTSGSGTMTGMFRGKSVQ